MPEDQNFISPCFMLPYIYCLRISEASGFRRKKLNMRNKLVMLSLVQVKYTCSFINILEGKTSQDTLSFHVADNKVNL